MLTNTALFNPLYLYSQLETLKMKKSDFVESDFLVIPQSSTPVRFRKLISKIYLKTDEKCHALNKISKINYKSKLSSTVAVWS